MYELCAFLWQFNLFVHPQHQKWNKIIRDVLIWYDLKSLDWKEMYSETSQKKELVQSVYKFHLSMNC